MDTQGITIAPAHPDDIPTLATISEDSFKSDSQTEMKAHGKKPFSMKEYSLGSLPGLLKNPKARVVKAVDTSTGVIMGHIIWGFRGIQPPLVSPEDTAIQTEAVAQAVPEKKEEQEAQPKEKQEADDPIARLEKLTGEDFEDWMKAVMGEGVRCLYVIGLYVSPSYQRRGVGSALLRWGTDLSDASHAFAWVHSSAGAWPAYERAGFKTIRTLDVDLDLYAPVPAPADRYAGGKWGHYVFRYMIHGTPPSLG
ncbi:putative GNAT family acetyltransferase [Lasiosphaeria hispida]|uniref:GNAT family acetyltransferase n=1 Tax=Lasiosphaeria hispida TaxID=260671 RepID=A0AAJ0HF95_9PEZI|nr:putative GNAT family acetyltransferase [Lasiosphaeria hispida]